jgi:hypothetical protein
MRSFFLTPSELYFALKSFAVKMLLFCVIEFLICQFDDHVLPVDLLSVDFRLPL